MAKTIRSTVRSIALTITAPVAGFLLAMALKVFLDIELSKLMIAVINLILVTPIAFVLFPGRLGIPFGRVSRRDFLHGIGFYFPEGAWKHVVLGLVLAGCTLSGMLIASILTGKYVMDASTINLSHLVFSLNPALWEELFYRGVLMIFLLKLTRSSKKAIAIQVVLFGLMHIKGIDLWAFVDVLSVMILAIGFTFVAHQTRCLVAGIVFHYFHDAFLLFVQLPDGVYTGVSENALFYGLLWLMVGIGCLIVRLVVQRFGVRAEVDLYAVTEHAQQ